MDSDLSCAKRIMIIGQPGSGKSTVARILGSALSLPVVHIDLIHWKSGWIERSREEKAKLCAQVHATDSWVFEGGFSLSWPERAARADAVIWLDLPILLRLWRVAMRTVKYHGTERPDLPKGCPERFDWEFYKWIWDTRKTNRVNSETFFNSLPADTVKFRMTSPTDVANFVEQLGGSNEQH